MIIKNVSQGDGEMSAAQRRFPGEKSGGRRRSRVSQRRRQDLLALWCAPTPEEEEEEEREREREREGERERERESTPPSLTVDIQHPCAKRSPGPGAQIQTQRIHSLVLTERVPLTHQRVRVCSDQLGHFGAGAAELERTPPPPRDSPSGRTHDSFSPPCAAPPPPARGRVSLTSL